MSAARNGKIARLPRAIRDELNARIDDGEDGGTLVAWLNTLPEAQAVVANEFGGVPISKHNLSEWRRGGFRDWQVRQETRELAEQFHDQAAAAESEGAPPLSDTLAHWVAAHYAASSQHVAAAEGREQWRLLRQMCDDVVRLRRTDHSTERMDLQRQRMGIALQIAELKSHRLPPEGADQPSVPICAICGSSPSHPPEETCRSQSVAPGSTQSQ